MTLQKMPQEEFDKIHQDVAKYFQSPHELIDRDNISPDQKIELLKQWYYDLHLLMVATEENMTGTGTNVTAEKMREVRAMLDSLGVKLDPDKAGPSKTGALEDKNKRTRQ